MTNLQIILNILLSLAAVLVVGVLGLVLVSVLRSALRVKGEREHAMRLENWGNTRSVFRLMVESPDPWLTFSFLYNNNSLQEVYESLPQEEEEVIVIADDPGTGSSAEKKQTNKSRPAASQSVSGAGAAMKTGRSAAGKAGVLASFLGALGNLIPGSAGRQLKSQSGQVRSAQTDANRAMNAPGEMKRQVNEVQDSGGRLVGSQSEKAASAPPTRASIQGQPQDTSQSKKVRYETKNVQAKREARLLYVVSPEVPAGQSLNLTLRIGTLKARYPRGSFNYVIRSEQVAPDFPEAFAEVNTRSGVVHFAPIAFWRYWLSPFASALMIVASLAAIVYAFMLIWY